MTMTDRQIVELIESPFWQDWTTSTTPVNPGWWNLTVSVRDLKMWSRGIKANRNWKVSDVKTYFNIRGNKDSLVTQIEAIQTLINELQEGDMNQVHRVNGIIEEYFHMVPKEAETFEAMGWHDPRWAGDRENVEAKFKRMYPTYTIEDDSVDYLVYSGGNSNKFHVFFLATDPAGNYHSFNAYGRVGYSPTLHHNAGPGTKGSVTQAISKKRQQKSKKGYVQQAESSESSLDYTGNFSGSLDGLNYDVSYKCSHDIDSSYEADIRDYVEEQISNGYDSGYESFEMSTGFYEGEIEIEGTVTWESSGSPGFDAEYGAEGLEEDRNSPAFEKWEEKFYLCYHDWQDDELHVDTFGEKYQITAYCSLCDATMLLTNLHIGDNGPDVVELPGRRPLVDFYDTSQEAYAAEDDYVCECGGTELRYVEYDDDSLNGFFCMNCSLSPCGVFETDDKPCTCNLDEFFHRSKSYDAETFKDGTGCISKGTFPSMTCEHCGFDPHDLVYYQCKQNDEDLTWDEWKKELEFYIYEGSHSEHCQGLIDEQAGLDAESENDYEKVELVKPIRTGWSLGAGIALFSVTATLVAASLTIPLLGKIKGDE